jgi:hypothetical protein
LEALLQLSLAYFDMLHESHFTFLSWQASTHTHLDSLNQGDHVFIIPTIKLTQFTLNYPDIVSSNGRFNHIPMHFMLALKVSNLESRDPILPFLISHNFNENTMFPYVTH